MKPQFLTGLVVRRFNIEWQLVRDLKYYTAVQQCEIIVPADFITDFASVPRIPAIYWLVGDIANKPATLHDFLYRKQVYTKKIADDIFLEAMKANGLGLIRRWVMYLGVKWFGRSAYDQHKDEHV